MKLPASLAQSPWAARLEVAVAAVRAAGAALVELRGTITGSEAAGGQLKTSTDLAAEGWVLGFLEGSFAGERMLAEERFEREGVAWPGARTYWTIDALDGTRSYVDGYDGFCVQVAYVEDGVPCLGVIGEPVTGAVYAAARGAGTWRITRDGATRLSPLAQTDAAGARFVDSTRPAHPLFAQLAGQFVECGSVGLKICRVVENAADIYLKQFNYKLWDVAPGDVLLREVGGVLSSWDGARIDYAAARTHFTTVLACPSSLHSSLVRALV